MPPIVNQALDTLFQRESQLTQSSDVFFIRPRSSFHVESSDAFDPLPIGTNLIADEYTGLDLIERINPMRDMLVSHAPEVGEALVCALRQIIEDCNRKRSTSL